MTSIFSSLTPRYAVQEEDASVASVCVANRKHLQELHVLTWSTGSFVSATTLSVLREETERYVMALSLLN